MPGTAIRVGVPTQVWVNQHTRKTDKNLWFAIFTDRSHILSLQSFYNAGLIQSFFFLVYLALFTFLVVDRRPRWRNAQLVLRKLACIRSCRSGLLRPKATLNQKRFKEIRMRAVAYPSENEHPFLLSGVTAKLASSLQNLKLSSFHIIFNVHPFANNTYLILSRRSIIVSSY